MLNYLVLQKKECSTILSDLLLSSCEINQRNIINYLLRQVDLAFDVSTIEASYRPRNIEDSYSFSTTYDTSTGNSPLHLVICLDDDNGQSPLHMAVVSEEIDLVSYYCSVMADNVRNKQDNKGNTALHLACMRQHFNYKTLKITQLLLMYINTEITNDERLTALKLAKKIYQKGFRRTDFLERLFDKNACVPLLQLLKPCWRRVMKITFILRLTIRLLKQIRYYKCFMI